MNMILITTLTLPLLFVEPNWLMWIPLCCTLIVTFGNFCTSAFLYESLLKSILARMVANDKVGTVRLHVILQAGLVLGTLIYSNHLVIASFFGVSLVVVAYVLYRLQTAKAVFLNVIQEMKKGEQTND